MSLYYESSGNGSRNICFVHGFTQTGKSWIEAANSIANSTNTFVDAPDHGESQGTSLTLQESGDAIAKIAHGMVLIGYSMGARMALHAAIQHPRSMTGLVLVSGTPGIEDEDERTLRVDADEALARHIESVGTSVFIEEWIRQPLFANSEFSDMEIRDRCRNTASSLSSSFFSTKSFNRTKPKNPNNRTNLSESMDPNKLYSNSNSQPYIGRPSLIAWIACECGSIKVGKSSDQIPYEKIPNA